MNCNFEIFKVSETIKWDKKTYDSLQEKVLYLYIYHVNTHV